MSFLAPVFFAGILLVGVPWLIHRIRRPEKDRVRFSSLMFVPNVKREVIERHRVQHILLMLLRMLILILLVLAFARPFQEVLLGTEASSETGTHHVVLLDVSLSMGAKGAWEVARREALALLDQVKVGDRVGVVRFAQRAWVDVPLSEDKTVARQTIEGATWTWEKGDYLVGLQAAADLLAGDANVQRVVHVVSDFQATGLPQMETGWALPGHMRLHPVVIGKGEWANASVDALALRAVGQQKLHVRARIKNWQTAEALTVRLWVDDTAVEAKPIAVATGHASLVRFEVPQRVLSGFVEVAGGDALEADNRQYFTFQPAPKHRVLVLGSKEVNGLMQAVVPASADLPWQILEGEINALAFENAPAVVVANGVTTENVSALRDYVISGGHLFLPLSYEAPREMMNVLLGGSGIQVGKPVVRTQQVPLFWVDLKHRIFHPFRGAKFNDFSSVRFGAYHLLGVTDAKILARFEGNDVMMAEGQIGKGKVLVWAGGIEMARSNLVRSPRFVPLVHETLRYLTGEHAVPPAWDVGDVVDAHFLDQPGVHHLQGELPIAVNVSGAESDPLQITPAEFEIRMCEAPVLYRDGDVATASVVGEMWEREEYGYWFLLVMFGVLLLEHFYAAWLESAAKQESK